MGCDDEGLGCRPADESSDPKMPPAGAVAFAEGGSGTARPQPSLLDRDRLLERQALLLREANHRVANSFQLVTSLLSLQLDDIKDPEAQTRLREAIARVGILARLHKRLSNLDEADSMAFHRYLQELCADFESALSSDRRPVHIAVAVEPLALSLDEAIPLGLVVGELVTRMAREADAGVTLRVALRRLSDGASRLVVEADGAGRGDQADAGEGADLGWKLVRSLLQQLGARIEPADGAVPGTAVLIPPR